MNSYWLAYVTMSNPGRTEQRGISRSESDIKSTKLALTPVAAIDWTGHSGEDMITPSYSKDRRGYRAKGSEN